MVDLLCNQYRLFQIKTSLYKENKDQKSLGLDILGLFSLTVSLSIYFKEYQHYLASIWSNHE